ncbi:MAG TPA: VOC family protein [Casimicrobiaceae bacterium]|nr:VOC family protein [Casimicrobiaceae bacterium]
MAGINQAGRRRDALGVHSINHFVIGVPKLDEAERFYTAFGLDVRRNGERLQLRTFGHPHCWGTVIADGAPKHLHYVSYGIYPEDVEAFTQRIARSDLGCKPHPSSDGSGLWLKDVDNVRIQLVVAPKVMPDVKSVANVAAPCPPGKGAAPARSRVAPVRPRRLSHILRFTPDVARMVAFCRDVLGMRLSDGSADIIAFMHGAHGSDHHLVAFAKSDRPGLHHTSWDVGSLDEVGCGAEQMRAQGFADGWGVGRHVIGSNYFYYVRDPWKSWAEYSFDIDYIPAEVDWSPADHPIEDSVYVWGPPMHPEFITNFEAAAAD